MITTTSVLYVFLGSGLGGVCRFLLSMIIDNKYKEVAFGMSVGTLSVNVLGSFIIALVFCMVRQDSPYQLLFMTGMMGGFTTFSSFSLQTVSLFQAGSYYVALSYIGLSLLLCVFAAFAGIYIGKSIWGPLAS